MAKINDKKLKKRVVVTGIGAVTPAGKSFDETWETILRAESPGGMTTQYKAEHMPSPISYEVKNFQFDKDLVSEKERPYLVRASEFAITALKEALHQAGLQDGSDIPDRTAVSLGVGQPSSSFDWFQSIFANEKFDDESLIYNMRNFPQILSAIVGRKVKAHAGNLTTQTACASSGQALGEAFDLIACGDADVVITGGADGMISPLHMAGFCLLGALATKFDDPSKASRPFDENRNGFVMGEGSCILVFEEYERAKARGATILGEVCGYGCTESAYRITDLHPEGDGPIQAMQFAVDDAGIDPSDVKYVNAHGTSTLLNDKVESLSVNEVFGKDADIFVSSTKSITGHMISAAGAMEFAICLRAVNEQILPPIANLERQDEVNCPVKLTPPTPTAKKMDYALSNSVGFGGSNTALIAGRMK